MVNINVIGYYSRWQLEAVSWKPAAWSWPCLCCRSACACSGRKLPLVGSGRTLLRSSSRCRRRCCCRPPWRRRPRRLGYCSACPGRPGVRCWACSWGRHVPEVGRPRRVATAWSLHPKNAGATLTGPGGGSGALEGPPPRGSSCTHLHKRSCNFIHWYNSNF